MTKDFLFVNGQIKALESRLLDQSRLERMVGAGSAEDAFRVMVELQYSEYFDDLTKPQDFGSVIEQGLRETKTLIQNGGNNHVGYDIFFAQFDLNNFKQALHRKLGEQKGPILEEEFNEQHGFSSLSNLRLEDLNNAVFEGKISESIPEAFQKALASSSSLFDEKGHFRYVEYLFDSAYGDHIHSLSKKSRDSFLNQLVTRLIDSMNFRALARSIALHKEVLPKEAFLKGGTLEEEDLARIETLKDLVRYISSSDLYSSGKILLQEFSESEKIQAFEQSLDRSLQQFLEDSASDDMQSIATSMNYFERRLRDARRLRFIMYSKFHGLPSDFIFSTLKTLS